MDVRIWPRVFIMGRETHAHCIEKYTTHAEPKLFLLDGLS